MSQIMERKKIYHDDDEKMNVLENIAMYQILTETIHCF